MTGFERFVSLAGSLVAIVGFVLAILNVLDVVDFAPSLPAEFKYSKLIIFCYAIISPFGLASFLDGMRREGKPTFILAMVSVGFYAFAFAWLTEVLQLDISVLQQWSTVAVMGSSLVYFFRYYMGLAGFEDGEGVLSYMFSPQRSSKAIFFLFAHLIIGFGTLFAIVGDKFAATQM